ncbi:MAG: L-2,4-diaminobutyrate decarboxylase [Actinomycetota bacterium]
MLTNNVSDELSLGDSRHEVLEYAADLVEQVWRQFDTPRDKEPEISPELSKLFQQSIPQFPSDPIANLDLAVEALHASIAQCRPRFLAYIGGSGMEMGALADLLAHSFDANLAIDAGAASRIEEQAIQWIGEFVNYPVTLGFFTSGGTISNITALAAARERALPGSRASGLANSRAAIYCSAEAHYSIVRAVELLGLGSNSIRDIPIDHERRMQPHLLRAAIEADRAEGITPIAVVATAGTTLTGAVDPLAAIADVCNEFGVWMHVDGAYGLPAAASSRGPLFAGLDRADSVSVDAHKWMFVPKACSAILVRDPAALAQTFSHNAAYVPHEGDRINAVDATLEYSRPLRALKLWMALRVHGATAFRQALQRNIDQADLLYDLAAAHPRFEVLPHRPQLSIVPIRHLAPGCTDPDQHNARLASAIVADNRLYISPAAIDGHQWLRPCFTNFRTQEVDVRATIDIVDEIGSGLCERH